MDAQDKALCDALLAGRRGLLATEPHLVEGQLLLERHAALIDEAMRGIYRLAWERASAAQGGHYVAGKTELALVATGGYGRREFSPFSDIDIAFVPSEEDNPFLDAVVREAFRLIVEIFLDASDLQVGYAFRTLSDCPTLDHQTKTSLLDGRLLAGSQRLFDALRRELFRHLDVVAFLQEKSAERQQRHHRLRTSLYAVEPNLKEGAGGLRDVHAALWMAQAMFYCLDRDPLRELERQGVVSAEDCQRLSQAREFLWRVRNYLHLASGRKTDVLLSEFHDRLARDFGYEGEGARPAQALLADYYTHAEGIHHFAQKITHRLLEGSLPLDEHFCVVRQRLRALRPHALWENPARVLRVFAYAQRYGFEIDPELDRLIEDALPHLDEEACQSSEAREAFLGILRQPTAVSSSLRQMGERGVLQRYLPEMQSLMRFVPSDPTHEFTVGEHSLVALDYLSELCRADRRQEAHPLGEALADIGDWEVMSLAVLLHDVGKLQPEGDHCVSGARMARGVGGRLNLEAHRVTLLETLVREHLLLPRTSRLRDIGAPSTIRELAARVGDVTTLKMLYVLAHVDTRAVGPKGYTNMDLRLLDELYAKVLAALSEKGDPGDWDARAAREHERVRSELRHLIVSDDALRQLSERLPVSYMVNTPLPVIATHLKFLERLSRERVIADFYHTFGDDFTELTLCAYDDPEPGLLSKVCGTLFANAVDIHSARVHTLAGAEKVVLDTLWISRDHRPLSERQGERIGQQLRQVLQGESTVEELLKKAGKRPGRVWVEQMEARNDLSDDHTVIHVVAEDAVGLLYVITRSLAALGLDIHTAKITTWAGKAEDAFYVTTRQGGKVPDAELRQRADALREELGKPD